MHGFIATTFLIRLPYIGLSFQGIQRNCVHER